MDSGPRPVNLPKLEQLLRAAPARSGNGRNSRSLTLAELAPEAAGDGELIGPSRCHVGDLSAVQSQ